MAKNWHVSAELFRRFLEQRVSRSERRAVVRHLIAQCPECLRLMARITTEQGYWFGPAAAAALAERDYGGALHTAFQFTDRESRRMAIDRVRGWAHWSALDPLLPEERLPVIVMHPEWQHWGLFRGLLDAAWWYVFRDPSEAADVVQLALDVVDLLSPAQAGGEAAANDLQAKAWAILANCRRLASDLEGAREALAEAWRLNEEGTGDRLEKAQLYSFDASYARTVGEFETAESILEQALSIYLAVGDTHMQGRTLLQMGNAIGYVDPEKGIAYTRQALELINPVREPRLEFCAQHDLVWFLTDAGRPQEALAVLDRARPLYKQFPDDWTQLRLHWAQGKIARRLDQFTEAAHIFRQVAEEFAARDLHLDFLMVSIDLAEAYAAGGELASAVRLLRQMTPVMGSWNLHRNALAAWLLLRKTLEERQAAGAAASELFSRIRLYYLRNWHVPTAEFSLE